MKPVRYSAVLVLMGLALSACNENDHDTLIVNNPITSLKGVVIASGYLQGATVCLDKNNNRFCDSAEPQAITNAQGQYSLQHLTISDSQTYNVIASVSVGGTDKNLQTTSVIKPYVLTTPIGYHAVISPITTAIHELVLEHSGMDIATAQQIAGYSLKVDSLDLMSDYSQQTGEAAVLLRTAGQFISGRLGEKQEWINTHNALPNYSPLLKHRVAVSDCLFRQNMDISFYNNFTELYNSFPNKINLAIAETDDYNILDRKFFPIEINQLSNLTDLYTFSCMESSFCKSPDNRESMIGISQLSISKTDDLVTIKDNLQSYDFIAKTVQPLQKNKTYIFDTNNGWIEGSESTLNPKQQKTILYKMDVSSLPMNSVFLQSKKLLHNQNFRQASPDSVFPANAYLYKLIRINAADEYFHQGNEQFIVDNLNSPIHTIEALKAFSFASPENPIRGGLGGYTVIVKDRNTYNRDFDTQLKPNGSVTLVTRTKTTDLSYVTIQDDMTFAENQGTWTESTINATKLLTVNVNSLLPMNTFAEGFFYTELDNKLVLGQVIKKGYVRENFLFNKTAMDAMKLAITSNNY